MRNMADNKDNAAKDSDILQHLPEVRLQHQMAWQNTERELVEASGTRASG
jgi:hypothetical protein